MATKKGSVVKLEKTGDGFGRESWYGFGPFNAKINDDTSLSLGLPDTAPQICTRTDAENERGKYSFWTAEFMGGKVFVSEVNGSYGHYLRVKLGDKVELPPEVLAKINKGAPAAKPLAQSADNKIWNS